jgi:hypothetical protein
MNYSDTDSSITDLESISQIIPDSFCDDISSIPEYSNENIKRSPWVLNGSSINDSHTNSPSRLPTDQVYEENLKLKKKIQQLERTLKKFSLKTGSSKDDSVSLTQSTKWLLSQKASFLDHRSDEMVSKEANKQLECETADCKDVNCRCKRPRSFNTIKTPQKFLKLAIVSSIGTLKF